MRGLFEVAEKRVWNERGATYLMVMIVVTVMGISLMALGKQWTIASKRDKEAELVFRGTRIKNAIETYAAESQIRKAARANQYPLSLEQLTQPPKRYLQMVYKDPMTGKDFELIKVGAEIRGVKSRSLDRPLNQVTFKKAKTYREILFQAEAATAQPCLSTANPINPLLAIPCVQGNAAVPGTPSIPQPSAVTGSALP
jgi:type II secretory pathway pseudopilin PulG